MTIDEEVILSPAGRRELEATLRSKLQKRMGMRRLRDESVENAFGASEFLRRSAAECLDLCHDLGFPTEEEAFMVLVKGSGAACNETCDDAAPEAVNTVEGKPR